MIVFDESHKIGAPSTEQYNNLMKLDAKYVIAATGTLIVNNPISAYPSLRFTKTDTATLTNYKAQYCTFGGFHDSQVIGYKNLGLLREEIDHYSIRRTLTDVKSSIPKLTIDTELLELSDSQQDFYEAIKKGIKEEADKIELNANNLLALTTRLRQATACPSVLTSQFIESVKVRRAFELVEEIIQQNEKVVVFSVFKEPLNQLAQLLQQANYDYTINTGDTSDAQVAVNVAAFQNSSRAQVFLGSFSKMGTG